MKTFYLFFGLCFSAIAYSQEIPEKGKNWSMSEIPGIIQYNRRILETDPGNMVAIAHLAEAYYFAKNYRECIAYCNILEDMQLSDELENDTISKDISNINISRITYLRAKARHKLGDYDKAWEEYNDALQDDPGNPDILIDLSNLSYNRNQYDSAKAYIRLAELQAPDDYRVKFNLANIYYAEKKEDSASHYYTLSIYLNPNYSPAWFYLATLKEKIGMIDSSIYCYSMAIRIDSLSAEYLFRRGQAYYLHGEYDSAELDFWKVLDIKKDHYDTKRLLTYILLMKGYPEKAMDLCDQMIDENNPTSEAYFLRSKSGLMLKRYDRALTDLDQAIQIDPERSVLYYWRGVTNYQLKNHKAACSDFDFCHKNGYTEIEKKYLKKCGIIITQDE